MDKQNIFLRQLSKKKKYFSKKTFNTLMNGIVEDLNQDELSIMDESVIYLPISKLKLITEQLEKFEENECFLKSSITLSNLSPKLNTNSKYLSKTINVYKKKTFTQYINDLRIEYLIEKLNTDKTFKNYTIQAIATEIGFNTPNAFSRAFFKKTGMYPSEYIKELDS